MITANRVALRVTLYVALYAFGRGLIATGNAL